MPRYDKYLYNNFQTWLYEPQQRDLFYLRSETDFIDMPLHSAEITLSLNQQQEGRIKQQKVTDPTIIENDNVRAFSLQMNTTAKLDNHLLTGGMEFSRDYVRSISRTFDDQITRQLPRGRFPDKAGYLSSGIFLQDEVPVGDKTYLTSGLRYAWFRANFKDSNPQIGNLNTTFSALTGSIAFLYKIRPGLQLSMVYANGFRAPNLSDLAKLGESKGNTYEVPNPNLNPEKINSFELAAHWETDIIEIDAGVYYSRLINLLTRTDAIYQGQTQIIIDDQIYKIKSRSNGGTGFITGSEFRFNLAFSQDIFLGGNAAYTYGQNQSSNEPFDGIPPFFGKLGLN